MATALQVASHILNIHGPMSTMKVQKLVYFSQAWHLVWRDRPLFDEPIEAWAGGPVVRSVWAAHRGQFMVTASQFGLQPPLAPAEAAVVDIVTGHYARWDGAQLSTLTHQEAPWRDARAAAGLRAGQRGNAVIDLNDMAEYYRGVATG